MTRDEVLEVLRQGACTIRYTKVDGSNRIAEGTLVESLIPANQIPSGSKSTYSEETIRYYDLNVNGWRSFRMENFQQVNLNES